jgi:NAD dependent epimerase/dehydratase family enzyme
MRVVIAGASSFMGAYLRRFHRRVVGAPFGIPTPRWMLELGSWAIRTETELVLESRWVLPERLVAAGFESSYAELEPAVAAIVSARR